MDGMPNTPAHATSRGKWQTAAIYAGAGILALVLGLLALGLLTASGASSYDNLMHLAVAHGVPMPRLNPLELDGGLVVITLADIALTLAGYPFAGLRFLARILGLGTIAANVAAGWPDPVGAFLRAFAPAIIVAVTEALRAFLLRRQRGGSERIPFARWLLAPVPTFRMWRRMKLWGIRSYGEAVDMELSRLVAIEQLAAAYPGGWQQSAPADLVWMLTRGVRMPDALARVAVLTGGNAEADALRAALDAERDARGKADAELETLRAALAKALAKTETLSRKLTAGSGRKRAGSGYARNRNQGGAGTRNPEPEVTPEPAAEPEAEETVDIDAEARIMQALAGGTIGIEDGILQLVAIGLTPSKAGKMAGRSDSYGRAVVRKARELSGAAPEGGDSARGKRSGRGDEQ